MATPDQIEANDVAIVLRPNYNGVDKWSGDYQVLISGFGPFTLPEENVRELISLAMLLASSVALMEKDATYAEKLMKECIELYGGANDIDINELNNVNDDSFMLSSTTKTFGGMQ
jgi:hypothetical protein